MKIFGLGPLLIGIASANLGVWNRKTCVFKPNHEAVLGPQCQFNLDIAAMSQPEFECLFRNEFWDDSSVSECNGSPIVNWAVMDVRSEAELAEFAWPEQNSFANRVVVRSEVADDTLNRLTCQEGACADHRIRPLFDINSAQFAASPENACGYAPRTWRTYHNRGYNGYGYMQFYNGLAGDDSDNYGLIINCGSDNADNCENIAMRVWGFFLRRHNSDINIRINTNQNALHAKLSQAGLAAEGEATFCSRVWRNLAAGNY